MARTIVLLGGSGFVGRALTTRWLAQGERVRVLSRSAGTRARSRPAGYVCASAHRERETRAWISMIGIRTTRGNARWD